MDAKAIWPCGAGDTAQEKITPAKENSGYLIIRAIYLHSSKGDTESTEFEMREFEDQNSSTRIRQPLLPRLWKSLVRPVATKEKSGS